MSLICRIIPGIVLMATTVLTVAHAQPEAKVPLVNFGNGEVITEKDLTEYLARRVDLKAASGNASGVMTIVQEMALARALALEGAVMGIERRTDRGSSRSVVDLAGCGEPRMKIIGGANTRKHAHLRR